MLSLRIVSVALAVVCAAQAYAVDSDKNCTGSYEYDEGCFRHAPQGPPAEAPGAGHKNQVPPDVQRPGPLSTHDKIVDILEEASRRVRDIEKELSEAVGKGYRKMLDGTEVFAAGWFQHIQQAVNQAKMYGVDMSDCISEDYGLKVIGDRIIEDCRQCIANEEHVVEEVQEKLVASMKQRRDIMDAAKHAFEKCTGLPMTRAIRCNAEQLLPHAVEAADMAVESASNVYVCVNEVFRTESQAAREVIENTAQCVLEKVQGNKPFPLYRKRAL